MKRRWMKVVEVEIMDVKITKTYGFWVALEFEIAITDHEKGKIYYLTIPKLMSLEEELKWYRPELFGVRGSPELTKKWEG